MTQYSVPGHSGSHERGGDQELSKFYEEYDTFTGGAATLAAAIAAALDALVPIGMIMIWHGSVASIPAGWHLCDGNSGTENLKDSYVYGAGGTKNPGDGFGAASANVSHTNNHSPSTDTLVSGNILPNIFPSGAISTTTGGHTHAPHGDHTVPTLPPSVAYCLIQRIS